MCSLRCDNHKQLVFQVESCLPMMMMVKGPKIDEGAKTPSSNLVPPLIQLMLVVLYTSYFDL